MSPAKRAISVVGLLVWFSATWKVAAAELPRYFVLELDIAIERGGLTGVFFDFGDGVWAENSAFANVPPGVTPSTLRLQLPTRPIRALRFDPTADDADVLIAGMRLLSDRGERLLQIDPKSLRPMRQIESIVPEGEGVRVHPVAKADDPMLRLDFPPLQKRMHDVMRRPTVGRGSILLLGLGMGAMVLMAAIAAWLALGKSAALLGGASIFFIVFGTRLALLNLFSRPVPFWDEWEGDALYILIPFVGGFLDWDALFMPQWEHRILLTRVITLCGTVLNGEWDPRVAMTVSAGMFSAMIAMIGTTLLATRRWWGAIAAALLAICAALPYDFNNLLWGGQTQMYGLVLMAVCTIGLASAPIISPAVCVGAFAASLISLVTMGAGPVAPGCAAGICLMRFWFERKQRRALAGLIAIFFGAALLGVFLHVSSRAHLGFYATAVAQFRRAFVGILAWPFPPHIAGAMLIWLPWVINGVLVLRRREASPLEWLAIGLGGWGMVNAIALGYARQYEGPPFDSRFFTPISVGVLGSICSSVALALRGTARKWTAAPPLAWGAIAAGLIALGINGIAGARESGVARAEIDQRIRFFLSTGDRAPLVEKPPHFNGSDVADRLESPLLRQILPAPYRRALVGRPSNASTPRIEAGPVTLTVRTLMKAGPGIAVIGLIGLGHFMWRLRPNGARPVPIRTARPSIDFTADWFVDRACYAIAAAITIGWFFIFNEARRDYLVDEAGHMGNIYHFLEEKPGWPEAMPMLPGYHFAVVTLWKFFHPPLELLTSARLVTTLMTLVGLTAFALAWRRIHGRPAGRATLLLALLPLTQPFTGMVYTDMPALAFALCAFWAQVSGRGILAALFLAGAVAVRQTYLAWAGFFVVWEILRIDESRGTLLRRICWLLILTAIAVGVVLGTGRLTVGAQHGNDFRFNLATIHFAGVLVLILGLPVWIAHAPATLRRWREAVRERPAHGVALGVCGAAAAAALAFLFSNPHVWNRELYWPGCSFTLLRNWPLVWIDSHAWLKAASGINIVLMAVALVMAFGRQTHQRELWLAVGFGALPVLTNSLVEPRYLIPAAGFILIFLTLDGADWRRLAGWWGFLTALHAPFVAKALSLW